MAVFNLNREDLVLRTFFTDPVLSTKMMPLLDPVLYKDEVNKNIVVIIRKFIKKYGRKPSAQELIYGLTTTGYSEDVREKLLIINNSEIAPLKNDFVVNMLENFYQESSAEELLKKSATAIYENNMDAVRNLLPVMKEKLNFSLHMNLGLDLINDIGEAQRRLRSATSPVPSGIMAINMNTAMKLDDPSTGGYPRKALSLLAAQPNMGKTLALCSESSVAVKNGYNVLYVSLELAEEYIWRRVAANLTGLGQYKVVDMTEDECKAAIYSSKNPGSDKFGILKVVRAKRTTTPTEIEAMLDSYESVTGMPVDLLVIDYIGILKPSRDLNSRDSNTSLDGQAKAEQIRELCIERNMAGLSAVQFNRAGYNNTEAGLEHLAESKGYAETGDLVITIAADPILRELGMYVNWIKKNRMGPNEIMFYTRKDYQLMRWEDATDEDRIQSETKHAEALAMAQAGGAYGSNRGGPPSAPRSSKPVMGTMSEKESKAVLNNLSRESMPM